MLSAYPACFFKESNGYSVIFPDLNYLSTSGETLEQVLEMAVDCLAGYLYLGKKEGEMSPVSTPINKINLNAIKKEFEIEAEEAFVNMVTVDVAEYAHTHFEKSVKKTLTIPIWLNNVALEQDINFSEVLQDALKKRLNVG